VLPAEELRKLLHVLVGHGAALVELHDVELPLTLVRQLIALGRGPVALPVLQDGALDVALGRHLEAARLLALAHHQVEVALVHLVAPVAGAPRNLVDEALHDEHGDVGPDAGRFVDELMVELALEDRGDELGAAKLLIVLI